MQPIHVILVWDLHHSRTKETVKYLGDTEQPYAFGENKSRVGLQILYLRQTGEFLYRLSVTRFIITEKLEE